MEEITRRSSRLKWSIAEGKTPMCGWFGCDKVATVDVWRANTMLCDEHYLLNIERFGCDLEGTAIDAVMEASK